jgi:hypothetical protein
VLLLPANREKMDGLAQMPGGAHNTPGADNRSELLPMDDSSSVRLCECGCGEPTLPAKWTDPRRGTVKGEPRRFLDGHHARKSPRMFVEEDRGYETPCWVWRGSLRDGYGLIRCQGKVRNAHLVFYEKKYGPMPEGMQADHLCRVRACVNPDHVEPVTHLENTRRGDRCKLTLEIARHIRSEVGRGVPQIALARRYGVSATIVCDIVKGCIWKETA